MSLETQIEALTAAINRAADALQPVGTTVIEKAAPRKKKKVASKTAANAAADEATTAVETATVPEAAELSNKDVADLIITVCKAKGREAAVKVLADFGVQKVPELKAEQYPAIVDALNALIAEK